MNPADISSRSCTSYEIKSSELLRNGPNFLKDTCDNWPDMPTCYESNTVKAKLVKKPQAVVVHSLVSVAEENQLLEMEAIFQIKRYSTKIKLLRITGIVLKFVNLLRRTRVYQMLNGMDLEKAEILWIQKSLSPEHYQQLIDGKTVIII